MTDDIQQVWEDIEYTFGYMEDKTYQKRAHEYLTTYGVTRSGSDTAVQCCVSDMVRRAYECGLSCSQASDRQEDGGNDPDFSLTAVRLTACSEMVDAALGMLNSASRLLE